MTDDVHRFSAVPGWSGSDGESDLPEGRLTADQRECWTFLNSVKLLQQLNEDSLVEIARSAKRCEYAAGTRVISQGDDSIEKEFYFIISGHADVFQEEEGVSAKVARLQSGDWFGELGLLADLPRGATVVAVGAQPLVVWTVNAVTFHSIIAQEVLIFRLVREQKRIRESGEFKVSELGLFSGLPMHDLGKVLRDATQEWFADSAKIVTQGEVGDRFYVVLSGTVEVIRDGTLLAELEEGDFFGETALIFDCLRTADVVAKGPALVWSINRDTFERIMRHYLLGRPALSNTISSRMRMSG